MSVSHWRTFCLAGLLSALVLGGGCGTKRDRAKAGPLELVPEAELGTRIDAVADVAVPEAVAVEGYGLVGGLAGTGAANCPLGVRAYLKRYIMAQMPGRGINVDELIDSENTAVVSLEGMIPAASSLGEQFDVRVGLLPGAEATSLRGGWLYKAELQAKGTFGIAVAALATVEGAVYVNRVGANKPDLRNGYILGGGRAANEYVGVLRLRRAGYGVASRIRNRLNERYGSRTAEAVSPRTIGLRIPEKYRNQKLRFIAMVRATYLDQTAELIRARIDTFVHQLAVSDNKESSEIALEAIGRESLDKVAALLNAADEEVRFRAARAMLNLGDDRALAALREIATDKKSPRRLEALEAVVISARRNDAASLARRLLQDSDGPVVLAAYEHLRRLGDMTVTQERLGRSFYLEQVATTGQKAIYVSRSGDPRIVLFGAPLTCRDGLFVESPDGTVVINSPAGQNYVAVMRKHPSRPRVIGPVRTGFELSDIIRTLGAEPVQTEAGRASGLGVAYADVIALVQQLVAKDAVRAEFWAGPLPKIGLIVKK